MFPTDKDFLVCEQQYADMIRQAATERASNSSNTSMQNHIGQVMTQIQQTLNHFKIQSIRLPQNASFSS